MTSVLERRIVTALRCVEDAVADRDPKAVTVWRFDEAPATLRALSDNGGDEDWLAVLPPGQTAPMWASPGSPFGRVRRVGVRAHRRLDGPDRVSRMTSVPRESDVT